MKGDFSRASSDRAKGKSGLVWTIVIAIIVVALGFLYFGQDNTTVDESLVVEDQAPGMQVEVERVTLTKPGFIVIYKRASDGTQVPAGTSDLLPAGVHENIIISLENPTSDGDTIVVVIHEDDGNGEFDGSDTDMVMLDESGEIVGEEVNISEDVEHEHEPVDDTHSDETSGTDSEGTTSEIRSENGEENAIDPDSEDIIE